mmetsp:Transcript_702/g.1619  ORF Transcript_702/g.1619 Transcript_702/m.1619 type:complete len:104 (-) Transcript_702:260-571(-)|eukprot:CAMPEP_0168197558 /NCGR_PEP_ID=MMETSP0139_2-20121125/21239_1 /TAXON_ID=44445 /ORGANISM="Pseudo-nitzschia australis, Strain 10249 10 AB" /LENGTH=103 /DNA_ID=CAMNT_0008122059 /DNA_START=118 /DNA_END=429 /DNA_ORIENTATION=+
MSSGVGVTGTLGRCYPFFADLKKCVSRKNADSPAAMCWGENEDYFECVHGFKEKKRRLQVIEEKKRREALGTKFNIHSDSVTDEFYSTPLAAGKIRAKAASEE